MSYLFTQTSKNPVIKVKSSVQQKLNPLNKKVCENRKKSVAIQIVTYNEGTISA